MLTRIGTGLLSRLVISFSNSGTFMLIFHRIETFLWFCDTFAHVFGVLAKKERFRTLNFDFVFQTFSKTSFYQHGIKFEVFDQHYEIYLGNK